MGIIIHDCDPTLFSLYRDPDDSLAIGFCVRRFVDDPLIVGITTVHGNASIKTTYRIARRIVKVSGSKISVYMGSSSSRSLGKTNKAVEFIISSAKEYGEIEILATGPLTNIASALLLYPELQDRVKRITIMGGSLFRRGNIYIFDAEFNFWANPVATKIVISKLKNIVLAPLDITMKIKWGRDVVEGLIQKRDKLARFLGHGVKPWSIVWSFVGGFNPHDTITAIHLYEPQIYCGKIISIDVFRFGKVNVSKKGKKVYVLLDMDGEKLKTTFLDAFI